MPWAQHFFHCHPLQAIVLCLFSTRLIFLKVHTMSYPTLQCPPVLNTIRVCWFIPPKPADHENQGGRLEGTPSIDRPPSPLLWEIKPTSARKAQQAHLEMVANWKELQVVSRFSQLLVVRYWCWDVVTRIIFFILPSTPSNTLIPLAIAQ